MIITRYGREAARITGRFDLNIGLGFQPLWKPLTIDQFALMIAYGAGSDIDLAGWLDEDNPEA